MKTRAEQIEEANPYKDLQGIHWERSCFRRGAEWADANPFLMVQEFMNKQILKYTEEVLRGANNEQNLEDKIKELTESLNKATQMIYKLQSQYGDSTMRCEWDKE